MLIYATLQNLTALKQTKTVYTLANQTVHQDFADFIFFTLYSPCNYFYFSDLLYNVLYCTVHMVVQ